MQILPVLENKKDYLSLLLLADEDEGMVDKYLSRGDMYVLFDPDPVAEIVVTDEGDGVFEIKNLAVDPSCQGRGYGRRLIEFAADTYRDRATLLLVGTGDSPLTVPFYQRCGFVEHHRIPNFFTDHYPHPIYEAGVLLTDMVVLARKP